uniref:Transmembrane protein n=1 Tax=Caenorhabditis japonica TaxID=281687 RepID=A0A8R1DXC0_CAEJA
MAKKEQKQREAGKSAAQHQLQQKLAAQKTVNAAAKDPSPSKKRLETKEKSRGFFSKLLRFVFTCIFYVSIITVTSSTIAIGLTCAGYENTAGVAPLCKDLSLLSSGKKASANLPNNFKNAFGAVLNGYQKQLQPYTAPVKKQVNDHYKKFAKTEIGGKIDKAIYNVHAKLVELFVKAQRFVRKQVDNVLVWWNKSGEKTFGPYLKGFVIGLKMVGEFVYDVILNIIAVIVHLSARVKAFFVAWTQGGFNAAMNTLNH